MFIIQKIMKRRKSGVRRSDDLTDFIRKWALNLMKS